MLGGSVPFSQIVLIKKLQPREEPEISYSIAA